MYKYFKGEEVELEEHMLYLKEIAQLYSFYSYSEANEKGEVSIRRPHSRLIKEIINEYMSDNNIIEEGYYYQTSKGLARVYPRHIYHVAIVDFITRKCRPVRFLNKEINVYTFKNGTTSRFLYVK
jgi:hypothetical protein